MKPVLVTTSHRGVFFGLLKEEDGNSVILERARCAIRWNTSGGFLELAKDGPNSNSRIGDEADAIKLFDVTSISHVTETAAAKWHAHENS